jgi:hypothetical protein
LGLEALLEVIEDESNDERFRTQCLQQFGRIGTSDYVPRLEPFVDWGENGQLVGFHAQNARARICLGR